MLRMCRLEVPSGKVAEFCGGEDGEGPEGVRAEVAAGLRVGFGGDGQPIGYRHVRAGAHDIPGKVVSRRACMPGRVDDTYAAVAIENVVGCIVAMYEGAMAG